MPDVTGVGDIGIQYPDTAGIAISGEAKAGALGFGVHTLTAEGVEADFHGTGSFTSAAASLSATATLLFSGTGAFQSAAASLESTGSLLFSGTGAFQSAASSLDILGVLSYNGSAAIESAASSLSGSGLVGAVTGVGSFTSAAASLSGRGRREKQQGGHSPVDLAGYHRFVNQGQKILEELGQVVPEPLPPVEIPAAFEPLADPAAIFDAAVAQTPGTITVPELTVRGKQWVQGSGGLQGRPLSVDGRGRVAWEARGHVWIPPGVALEATGQVDPYATIRRQDDALIEAFICNVLMGKAA